MTKNRGRWLVLQGNTQKVHTKNTPENKEKSETNGNYTVVRRDQQQSAEADPFTQSSIMSSATNNKNNDDIVPDMPQMRSVLIRSSVEPAMPSPHNFGISAKSAPWSYGPSTKIATVGAQPSWKPVNVPKLPEMYPLERSHVSIADADAVEIAMRIADCLRKESIAATFEEVRLLLAPRYDSARLKKNRTA
jgi:hypothetical protein